MTLKKNIQHEQGYAFLAVLLLIIFITVMTAVLMRGSISNAKQEQIVDQNHLAIVAAEMGIDYYSAKIRNEELLILESVLQNIEADVQTYNVCGGVERPENSDCRSVKSISAIERDAKKEYRVKIESLLLTIEAEEEKRFLKPENHAVAFELFGEAQNKKQKISDLLDSSEWKNHWKNEHVEIRIPLEVTGTSKATKPKTLNTVITFTVPNFVMALSLPTEEGAPQLNEKQIFEAFKKDSSYQKKAACSEKNGHCQAGKYYSEGPISANNPNNQNGLIWIHDGHLHANNMNQMNFTLIVNSLTGKNMNKMNGKLVLIGSPNQHGQISDPISIKFAGNGRVCVNVDGFSKRDIEKLSFDSSAKIYFHSSQPNPKWPNNSENSMKHTGSLTAFINDCVGQAMLPETASNGGDYRTNHTPTDIHVDVSY